MFDSTTACGRALPLAAVGLVGYLLVFWHENGFDTVGSTENLVDNLQRLLAYSGILRISEEKNARSRVG